MILQCMPYSINTQLNIDGINGIKKNLQEAAPAVLANIKVEDLKTKREEIMSREKEKRGGEVEVERERGAFVSSCNSLLKTS